MTARFNDTYSSPPSRQSRYRPEIDGLRAFAVVAVIVNHFNKDMLPGGYLGVDIFFVISGYVITSSLFERPSKNLQDFISGFYERRIKRLVPALSVFVLITSIVICLFNPSPGLSLQTGLASLFGLSNLYLLKQSTDYFALSTELNVFTHTWSLGVEEQFYILFPFFIWFSGFGRQTKNGARNLFLIVGALTIASLIGFLSLYPSNQPAAYFLMPSRFWEMAAGCLIFIGFQKRASIEQFLEKVPPLVVLALIVGTMYLPMSLATASTIAVVALSSILIASLKKQTAAFKVFTHPRVVYFGLISYSLYLWHWGVLSISRWTIGIHWWSVPFQIALMLGLAVASYRWIETPLRKGNWFGRRWKTLVVGGGVLVLISGGLVSLDKSLKVKLYTGREIDKNQYSYASKFNKNVCHSSDISIEELHENCLAKESATSNTLYLVGDSHAFHNHPAAWKIAKDFTLNFASYTWNGLAFPVVPYRRKDNKKILSDQSIIASRSLEQEILHKSKSGDLVIIFMRFDYHFGDEWLGVRGTDPKSFLYPHSNGTYYSLPDKRKHFEQWKNRFEEFADIAREREIHIIVSTPTPLFPLKLLKIDRYMQCKGDEEWFNVLQKKKNCIIPSDVFIGNQGKFRDIFDYLNALKNKYTNVTILDSYEAFCNPHGNCMMSDENSFYFKDMDHVSDYGSMKLIYPKLKKIIAGLR